MKNIPEMQNVIPEKPEDSEYEIQEKPICLLIAHMHGLLKDYGLDKDPQVAKDLELILRCIPSYLDIVLQTSMVMAALFKVGQSKIKISAKNILGILQFS